MAENLISPGIAMTETDQSAVAARPIVAGAALIGPTVKGPVNVPKRVTSYRDYVRTFGTTFTMMSGSTPVQREFLTSVAAKSYFEQGGETLLVTRVAPANAFQEAYSTTILANTSSITNPIKIWTLNQGAMMNNAVSGSYATGSDGYLESGSANNLRWDITAVNADRGTFSLTIRRGDDTDVNPIILESFNNLSLDPESENYIARVIGDQYEKVVVSSDETYVETLGNYTNKSAYIRVEVLKPTPGYYKADGVTIASGSEGRYDQYLPKEQSGCFMGGVGNVDACHSADAEVSGSAEALFFEDLKVQEGTNDYNQTIKATAYDTAIDILANTEEYQFNIISAPGYFGGDKLISLAQERGDCIAVVDVAGCTSTVADAAAAASAINSSYGATYFPWLQMYSATGKLEWCPASTVIPGVYTYTDHAAAPWYAPAGMTRGGVQGVIQTRKKLTKAMRDTLYEKNVNPIATMPGAGIVVYGQKTLQKKASALDRVNVRRLLIEVKSRIKEMAAGLLFENNTTALQNAFRAQLDAFLASVAQRNGLYAYQISLDGNTPEAIDRNEFHAAVVLQPTKVIEYIYLDFTITSTGVEFN